MFSMPTVLKTDLFEEDNYSQEDLGSYAKSHLDEFTISESLSRDIEDILGYYGDISNPDEYILNVKRILDNSFHYELTTVSSDPESVVIEVNNFCVESDIDTGIIYAIMPSGAVDVYIISDCLVYIGTLNCTNWRYTLSEDDLDTCIVKTPV